MFPDFRINFHELDFLPNIQCALGDIKKKYHFCNNNNNCHETNTFNKKAHLKSFTKKIVINIYIDNKMKSKHKKHLIRFWLQPNRSFSQVNFRLGSEASKP